MRWCMAVDAAIALFASINAAHASGIAGFPEMMVMRKTIALHF